MRAHPRGSSVFAGVGVLLLSVTACGARNDDNAPTATAGTSGVQVEIGNTVNYGSFGTTADIDCADGKSLTVGGSNNTLKVTGRCHSVNVGGADNKLTLDDVTSDITTVGINNAVTYRNGDPTVKDLGSGNSIRKG